MIWLIILAILIIQAIRQPKQFFVALKITATGLICLLPTPTYGNHGGFYKESKKSPVDEMDRAFLQHDQDLEIAYERWQERIKRANQSLFEYLEFIPEPSTRYARFYWKMSKIIFSIGSGRKD